MKGLVVLSGGQDSTTCLGVALDECIEVNAVTFEYGQKHEVEVLAARHIANKYHVPLLTINLKPILENMTSSALITHGDTTQPHPVLKGLPASFVPARNALFLTIAYGLAMEHKCGVIYAGMCETDYSGYPDCRHNFITMLNSTLDIGYESMIHIKTPLMFLNKAETFNLAKEVGVLDTVLQDTVTCYDGVVDKRWDWGRGCGECPACKLRAKGWEEYVTRYVAVSE